MLILLETLEPVKTKRCRINYIHPLKYTKKIMCLFYWKHCRTSENQLCRHWWHNNNIGAAIDDKFHYSDVIMGAMASQIIGVSIICSAVCSERKHQSSASLAFVRGIHRSPVDSPHKGPVSRKMSPFYDVIMYIATTFDFQGHGSGRM